MAAGENRLGVPPPRKMLTSGRPATAPACASEVANQRVDVALLRQCFAQRVRVEIAVRTFLHAPRKVHVERERRGLHAPVLRELREKARAAPARDGSARVFRRRASPPRYANPPRHERRVVAEATTAAARIDDVAFPGALSDERPRILGVFDKHDDAAVARRALRRRHIAQRTQQLVEIRLVAGVLHRRSAPNSTPGAPPSASTSMPGIIGDGRQAREARAHCAP